MRVSIFLALIVGASLSLSAAQKLEVSAGDSDRHDTVVSFEFKDAVPGASYVLAGGGESLPVQVDPTGRAMFVLPELAKGKSRTYEISRVKAEAFNAVTATKTEDKLHFEVAGKEAFAYVFKGSLPRPDIKPIYLRSGYLQGVATPSGVVVTDDYPKIAHLHHHSVWFPWTHTVFEGRDPDFWNMGDGKGRVEFVGLDQTWSGPVSGGFVARHRFVDMMAQPEKTALNEVWTVRLYSVGTGEHAYRMFDLESVQECATGSPLILPEYRYGGIGIRGHEQWDGKDNCFYLPSNGITDRVKAHTTRADWCHMGGQIDGKWAGIAIFGDPNNFRAPQPMRVHPKEPFFNFAPSQAGDWSIEPGKPYVSKYRFVVADGKPDAEELNRIWKDYATPPTVRWLD